MIGAMTMRSVLTSLAAALFILAAALAEAQTSLDTLLERYLPTYGLPALGAAVVKDGKIVAAGAVGTRKAGEKIPVTPRDRFHLGSDTKAITALLAAMLVEEGKLRWTSTVAEVWGEVTFPWAPEPFVYHGGSNEKNLAHILLQPKHDFAVVLVTNISGPKADQAFHALAEQLYRRYSGRP